MTKKEEKNFEYNDEFCGECGCGVECNDPMHHHTEDIEFDDEETIMHLVLDDDTELECRVIGFFEVDDNDYVALIPVDEKQAESGVLIYKYIELENDEFDLLSIEDDKEFDTASEAFNELFSDDDFMQYGTHEDEEDFVEYENYDEAEE